MIAHAPALSAARTLQGEAATAAFARALAPRLGPGDTILLEGPIGAGKTHFARALIQERLRMAAEGAVEDVPSPSYTLVQVYEAGPLEIWHCDLYRLSGTDEVAELGLDEAFVTALVLVEWPDRLGALAPPDALTLSFSAPDADPGARHVAAAGPARWGWVAAALVRAAAG
jgi:tRNA threonylcarbamoyladenosine biosynthesis protein TsaE